MQNRTKLSIKLISMAVTLIVTIIAVGVSSYAWFYIKRVAKSDDMKVDIPPIIYVKDDNLQEMTTFNLDGLQVNANYAAVFCVSPVIEDVVDQFDLTVIYTENIGMKIDLYEVYNISEATDESGEGAGSQGDGSADVSSVIRTITIGNETARCSFNYHLKNGKQPTITYGGWTETVDKKDNPNRAVYKKYSGNKFYENDTQTSTGNSIIDKLNNTKTQRFFVLEVTWPEEVEVSATAKEVDVVYIVAKG